VNPEKYPHTALGVKAPVCDGCNSDLASVSFAPRENTYFPKDGRKLLLIPMGAGVEQKVA
jgi:hypothetical protein